MIDVNFLRVMPVHFGIGTISRQFVWAIKHGFTVFAQYFGIKVGFRR